MCQCRVMLGCCLGVFHQSMLCVCIAGSAEFQEKFHVKGFIYVDPCGAMLISICIMFNWWKTGSGQSASLPSSPHPFTHHLTLPHSSICNVFYAHHVLLPLCTMSYCFYARRTQYCFTVLVTLCSLFTLIMRCYALTLIACCHLSTLITWFCLMKLILSVTFQVSSCGVVSQRLP